MRKWTGRATSLALSRLEAHTCADLADRHPAWPMLLSVGLANEIAVRADGVPLFVEEITKAALELSPPKVA